MSQKHSDPKHSSDKHADVVSLTLALAKATRNFREMLADALATEDITAENWLILVTLKDLEKGLTMTELSHSVDVLISGLSKNIDKMVSRALVYRQQDSEDQRRVLVFISDFGLEVLERVAGRVEDVDTALKKGLTARQRDQIRKSLLRIGSL